MFAYKTFKMRIITVNIYNMVLRQILVKIKKKRWVQKVNATTIHTPLH